MSDARPGQCLRDDVHAGIATLQRWLSRISHGRAKMNRRIQPQVALVGWPSDGDNGCGSPDAVMLLPINTTVLCMGVFFQLLIGYYRGIVRGGGVVGVGRHAVGLHTKFSGRIGMDLLYRSLLPCRLVVIS